MSGPPGFASHGAGLTWIAPTPAVMRRASQAVALDGDVWLVDPVDVPGLDEAISGLGTPRAVVQLLDRHPRDCAAVASKLGVPHIVLPAEDVGPFTAIRLRTPPGWHEVALWEPGRRILAVADAVGTASYFRARGEALGVHPFLRMFPPGVLRGLAPEHLLVGHGPGIHGPDAAPALEEALRTSRRRIPRWLVGLPGARRRI